MQNHFGVFRNGPFMQEGIGKLAELRERIENAELRMVIPELRTEMSELRTEILEQRVEIAYLSAWTGHIDQSMTTIGGEVILDLPTPWRSVLTLGGGGLAAHGHAEEDGGGADDTGDQIASEETSHLVPWGVAADCGRG